MLNVQEKQFHKWDITCFLGKNVCYHALLFWSILEMTKESLSRAWLHTHIYDKSKSLIC